MDPWTPPAPPFATWDVLGFDQTRVTEDGRRRVIEQDSQVIRIIERFNATWTKQPTTANPWS